MHACLRRGCSFRLLALALGLFSGFAMGADKLVPAFHGQDVTGAGYGRDFRLQDASGQWRTPRDYQGKLVLMFFGFTQCPDVCPTELQRMARLMTALGKEAARVQVLFVTLDPVRDTATMLQSYVGAFNPRFIGLRADEAATAGVAREFKVFYRKVQGYLETNLLPHAFPHGHSFIHPDAIPNLHGEPDLHHRYGGSLAW